MPVWVIAEAGTGHDGDLHKGKVLVEAAARAGADAVKFQHVYADEILHPKTGTVALPGGDIDLYERFRSIEQPVSFFAQLKATAEAAGISFFATPFGVRSARELRDLGVATMKVASPELNHTELLTEISRYGLPTILSTGVSTLADIEYALSIVGRHHTTLLHCITAYPAPEEEYNLKVIATLSAVFGVAVGLSDHSRDPVLVPTLAVAQGATIVEKHLTVDRLGDGLDDPIAIDGEQFTEMVQSIRQAEAEGDAAAIKRMEDRFTANRVRRVLGDGVKRPATAEAANVGRSNRSIHATRHLRKGTPIGRDDLSTPRTEQNLTPGEHPMWMDAIVGRRPKRDIADGEGVRFDDLQ